MKLKEYRIPMPLTLDEYRLGQQWTEIELLRETLQTSSTCVTFYDHVNEQERSEIITEKVPHALQSKLTSSTPMTHRKYHIKDQQSKLFDFFLFKPKIELILDEYSWDRWPYTLTIVENLENDVRIVIQSCCQPLSSSSIDPTSHRCFSLTNEQTKALKDYELINISERCEERREYRADEDPTRNVSRKKAQLLPLQANSRWYENTTRNHPLVCVCKLIELVMLSEGHGDSSLLTKATNRLIVRLRSSLVFVAIPSASVVVGEQNSTRTLPSLPSEDDLSSRSVDRSDDREHS